MAKSSFDDLAGDFGDEWSKKKERDDKGLVAGQAKEAAEKERKEKIESDVATFAATAFEVLDAARAALTSKGAKARAVDLTKLSPNAPGAKLLGVRVNNDQCEWIATLTIERPDAQITIGFVRTNSEDRDRIVAAHRKNTSASSMGAVPGPDLGKVPIAIDPGVLVEHVRTMIAIHRPK